MIEFTGFKPEHVNAKVYDIIKKENGIISHVDKHSEFSVVVEFEIDGEVEYTSNGLYYSGDKDRRLYFGHDLKVEVTGEEVPEPALICPVCCVEHKIKEDDFGKFYFYDVGGDCPLNLATFKYENHARFAIRKLIKAMEK